MISRQTISQASNSSKLSTESFEIVLSVMARRRAKKRTHVGARNGPHGSAVANTSASRAPKSMVIRIGAGEVGPSVSQLVKDVRDLMEPGTASRLKVRALTNVLHAQPVLPYI